MPDVTGRSENLNNSTFLGWPIYIYNAGFLEPFSSTYPRRLLIVVACEPTGQDLGIIDVHIVLVSELGGVLRHTA